VGVIVGYQSSQQLMEGLNQVVVAQAIINHGALFTSIHQVQTQQMVQMLRSRGSGQSYLLSNLPCTQFIGIRLDFAEKKILEDLLPLLRVLPTPFMNTHSCLSYAVLY
jgi:hypothetical protein